MSKLTAAIFDKFADGVGAKTEANGFVYVDGQLIASVINKMAITAILAQTWVVPGVACSEELTEGVDANKIWSCYVQVTANIGPTARTFGPNGTTGNNGIINFSPAVVMTDDVIEIKLNQIDDQPLFFPRIQMETMRYDKVKATLENYMDNLVVTKATYETAVAIAYAHFRASAAYHSYYQTKDTDVVSGKTYYTRSGSEGSYTYSVVSSPAKASLGTYYETKTLPEDQFIKFDSAKKYDENYMIEITNEMDERMSAGDPLMNAMTFAGNRAVMGRLSFINAFKTPKSGFVTVGSDAAFKLLTDPSFDTNNIDVFGDTTDQKRMDLRGYSFYEIPKNAFEWIEAWLGLPKGSLNKIHAVITSPLQLATGGVLEADVICKEQVAPYPGTYMAPYRKFGARGYRNIILVVEQDYVPDATLIGTDAAITEPKACVAPANWAISTVQKETVENTLSKGPSLTFASKAK